MKLKILRNFFLSFNFRTHDDYKETQNKPRSPLFLWILCSFDDLADVLLFSEVSFETLGKKNIKNKQVHVTCPFISDVSDSIE